MTIGIGCFHCNGELTLCITGVTVAPVVVDEDSGRRAELRPAQRHADLLGVAETWINGRDAGPDGTWWGELKVAPGATEAHLRLELGDVAAQRVTARWQPEPEPAPKASRPEQPPRPRTSRQRH
jgi:hypothetical protein